MNKINKYFLVILDTVFKYVGLNWTLKHSVDFPKFWHKVCIVLEVKDVNDKDGIIPDFNAAHSTDIICLCWPAASHLNSVTDSNEETLCFFQNWGI